jgi:hypothetical protein
MFDVLSELCLKIQVKRIPLPLKMKDPLLFEMSGTTHPATQRHVVEDLIPFIVRCHLVASVVRFVWAWREKMFVLPNRKIGISNVVTWVLQVHSLSDSNTFSLFSRTSVSEAISQIISDTINSYPLIHMNTWNTFLSFLHAPKHLQILSTGINMYRTHSWPQNFLWCPRYSTGVLVSMLPDLMIRRINSQTCCYSLMEGRRPEAVNAEFTLIPTPHFCINCYKIRSVQLNPEPRIF